MGLFVDFLCVLLSDSKSFINFTTFTTMLSVSVNFLFFFSPSVSSLPWFIADATIVQTNCSNLNFRQIHFFKKKNPQIAGSRKTVRILWTMKLWQIWYMIPVSFFLPTIICSNAIWAIDIGEHIEKKECEKKVEKKNFLHYAESIRVIFVLILTLR